MSRLLDLSLSLVDIVSLLSLSSSEGKEFMFDLEEKKCILNNLIILIFLASKLTISKDGYICVV